MEIQSGLSQVIPPEIKNDAFYNAIQQIASKEDVRSILEIGSSSGQGSTEAFVQGILRNPSRPNLFCIEISRERFQVLRNHYKDIPLVKCYNVSSVSVDEFPSAKEVENFYKNAIDSQLTAYPLEQVISWLNQDIQYLKKSNVPENGIEIIREENGIDIFDVVLIDGSEFTGNIELEHVYGANYILLDDINTFKNYESHRKLLSDPNYTLLQCDLLLRNGYSVFKKNAGDRNEELNSGTFTSKTCSTADFERIRVEVELVPGFMMPGQEEYLFNKVRDLPDDAIIVEIGSYLGRSTIAMAYACVGTNRKIYCIDTWDGNDSDFSERSFFDIWQENVKRNSLEDYVIPLQGYSHDILPKWNDITDNKAIDFIFIDGSHQYLDVLKDLELSFPLVKDCGWMAFHDVIQTWPGSLWVWRDIALPSLDSHEYCGSLACGQKKNSTSLSTQEKLPIHFFTIVLNGEPFIRYHIDALNKLPFSWHWHVVEGVADLKHDTAWSLKLGGKVTEAIHRHGLSIDGTTDYLDQLAQEYPNNITIYRKPSGEFWDGKLEMVSAPLTNIQEECLLWQIDVDELWTVEQICAARNMFLSHPDKTAAFYWCWYFVGQDLIVSSRNCYSQNPQQDWLRTWRFKPGYQWASHEPPRLVELVDEAMSRDIASINPFLHQETEARQLVFQHFAYVTPEQLEFKESYYGYKDAVSRWQQLQEETRFPIHLKDFFPWVTDLTTVDKVENIGIKPIAQAEVEASRGSWTFLSPETSQAQIVSSPSRYRPYPQVVIDGVFFQLYNTGIARVWKSLIEYWSGTEFRHHLIILDRGGTAPRVSGIHYRIVPKYDYGSIEADRAMLQNICNEEGADLFISTYYTTPIDTPSVFMAYDMIPEVMGWDVSHPMWHEKHRAIQQASAYLAISQNTAIDLARYFPHIVEGQITVALCGVSDSFSPASLEEVQCFKTKYGIVKPYFVLVGAAGGSQSYKNAVLFFQAFAQMPSKSGFEVVCTSGTPVDEAFREYGVGTQIHSLRLSDEELRVAYSGAIALVYPSKYEGFGLPIVEAMASGCPVITTPNASIPEVAGDAAIYVNDDDIKGMADALCEVQKPSSRQVLIDSGLARARQFTWQSMAEKVQTALIRATLSHLNLRDINYIAFPDWTQPEEVIGEELQNLLRVLASHPDQENMTLVLDSSQIDEETAGLLISGIAMNLMLEEDVDLEAGLEIALAGTLKPSQWQTLLSQVRGRIVLPTENAGAIDRAQAGGLPRFSLEDLEQTSEAQ